MSINSMANAATARRDDTLLAIPKNVSEIAVASMTTPVVAGREVAGTQPAAPSGASQVDTAYNVLFGYIPTEIVTLYVAFLAAVTGSQVTKRSVDAKMLDASTVDTATIDVAFWCFLIATPLVVWVAYAVKCVTADSPLPYKYTEIPLWEMVAASISFIAWGLVLPFNPLPPQSWYTPAIAGVMVLMVSTALGLISPLFQNKLKVQPR